MSRRSAFALCLCFLAGCQFDEPSVCAHLPDIPQEAGRTGPVDANLEALAISLSQGITADDDIYRRLVRDISAIRAVDSRIRGIRYEARDNGELIVALTRTTKWLVQSGLYTEWNCLNRHFDVKEIKTQDDFAILRFDRTYDMSRVGEIYSGLDGVRYAEPVVYVGFERGASIIAMPEADGWRYVLGGAQNCGGNEIECSYYYFDVGIDGVAKLVEEWRPGPDNSLQREPSWLRDAYGAHMRALERRARKGEDNNRVP